MADNIINFTELKKKRDDAQAEAQKALDSNEAELLTPELLTKLVDLIDGQDKVTGMLLHDMMILAKKLEMVEVTNFNNAASLQVVITILKEKFADVVKQSDFQEIWERDIAPQLQELQEKQKAAEKKESSDLILPNNTIITP